MKQWNSKDYPPQTFQDTALLCYRIDIKYLWIDSLCIIQVGEGSAEDWSLHVTEMQTVYSNGMLNITASRAASSNEGMYSSRNPRLIKPAIIQGSNNLGMTNGLHLLINYQMKPGVRSQRLNERGWVFQERLLSRRVIHFEEEQVYWQCCSSTKCETYPAGYNKYFDYRFPFDLPKKNYCNGSAERWDSFTRLVHGYSGLRFTFPNKDKLAAFASIAQHITHELDVRYVARIWFSQLPVALWYHPGLY
ncbi:hypothetical protein P171DRAFT_1616 [Karstenula rhodostoma CBS 690.94]|uniref:Heterokaryon incompatibility domain-containing protein n=1 Tax=Karstenula rhodostoma CBS 690.94 TaxID=1392251 RepID=A0A9P4PYK8_9PLEO|nr:hypothetical protein P171DRAFT_1616 [Karstenula rhodostoma CBS 690.94]